VCDDSLSSENLQFLTKEAKNKLGEEEFREYTKYACAELADIPNDQVQHFLDRIDIPKINVQIAEDFTGGKYVICNRRGVLFRRVKTFKVKGKDEYWTRNYDKEIICAPFELFEIFMNQNDERFYKIKIGNEDVCLNKKDLIDFIQVERNYNRTYGKQLFEAVSIVLREFEKKKKLSPKNMFPAVGVFWIAKII